MHLDTYITAAIALLWLSSGSACSPMQTSGTHGEQKSTHRDESASSTLDQPNEANAHATQRLYLDVRTLQEFAEGHIPGATHIPLHELEDRLGGLGTRDTPITTYCRSGNRSGQAKAILETAGFTDVRNGGGASALAKELGVELKVGLD